MAPLTSEMPASPASAPENSIENQIILREEKPAKRPARSDWPRTVISKPFNV